MKDFKFYKKVLLVALPVMFQQFITTFGQLIDNLMVGTIGAEAISAVSASNSIFFVVMLMMFGVSEASSIFIAQYYGAGNEMKQKHAFFIGIIMSLFLVVLSMAFIKANDTLLLSFYLNSEQSINLGVGFINIVIFSYLFFALNTAIGSGFRAVGLPKIPMIAGITAIVINTILNFCLITGFGFFPELGIQGAAIATVISRIVETLFLLIMMKKDNTSFNITKHSLRSLTFSEAKEVVKKALPLTANEALWAFGMSFILAQYGFDNEAEFASVSIANTISSMFYVVMSGFAVAASILIGHELGKNKIEQAKKNAKKMLYLCVYVGFAVTILYVSVSFFVPYLYNVTDEIRIESRNVMIIQALYFPIYMVCATCFFIMRAGGDSLSVLLFDSLVMVLLAVPMSYLLARFTDFDVELKYTIVESVNIIKVFLGLYFIRKAKWAKNLTVND